VSKKLEQKQQRRLAEEERKAEQRKAARRRNMVTATIAIIVIAAVTALIISDRAAKTGGSTESYGVSRADAGCQDIEKFKELDRGHIAEGATPEPPYNSDPPTSGQHYEVPAGTGFYASPIERERLVHNLEHGQIVIWYSPETPQTVIDEIEKAVNEQPDATVAAPYDGVQPPENVVLSAWGVLQRCQQVSQDVVDEFRTTYQGKGPEALTPPFNP
jgi:hypothetical protein